MSPPNSPPQSKRVDILRPDHLDRRPLFTHEELMDPETGEVRLAEGFAGALARLRLAYAKPMRVTSCCRSASHNIRVGGHPHSLHVYDEPWHPLAGAAAIDIAVTNAADAWQLVRHALLEGWSIGVASWGVHLDRRDFAGKPPGVFGYGK